jgi:hypothetical protein
MIAHETFTRRIRDRLAIAGAAPRARSGTGTPDAEPTTPRGARGRRWAAEPLQTDEKIRENTGHTWDEWADLIEAGPGRLAGHTAIAAWVQAEHGLTGWWAQGVTVSYERIAGLRLPGQMPDGTFSVSRSRVLELSVELLRAALLDDAGRADLFPGIDTVLRSKPASKALRFAASQAGESLGSLLFSADPLPDGRLRVTVTHDKLPGVDEGEAWKQFWADWLAAVAQASAPDASAPDPQPSPPPVPSPASPTSGVA